MLSVVMVEGMIFLQPKRGRLLPAILVLVAVVVVKVVVVLL